MSLAFTYSRLILCEGVDDDALLKALLRARNLPRCHVVYTRIDRSRAGGNSKFGLKLRALRAASERNFQVIKKVLIVSDNDEAPDKSFAAICKQIVDNGFGPAPGTELTPSSAPLPITIAMLPIGGGKGCLETVCVHAARRKRHITAGHVDTFRALLGGDNWPENRKGKMWLRSWLAAECERDPFVALQNVFADPKVRKLDLIPPTDGAFRPLADAIAQWAS